MQRISNNYKLSCVLKEELKAMHGKIQLIVEAKRMMKIMLVRWCILIMTSM